MDTRIRGYDKPFDQLGSDPNFYGCLMFFVGGCPCGRMCAVAPGFIREQGLAPTQYRSLSDKTGPTYK
jgi:hypothetical protein